MDIDYKAIGRRIKFARIKKDITQEKIADIVDLSSPHVSNIETGRTKLGLPTIISLANALGVSVDELLMDNLLRSRPFFEREAREVFEDCTEHEIRILVDVIRATKDSIRKHKPRK